MSGATAATPAVAPNAFRPSSADFPLFFDPSHDALAARLVAAAPRFHAETEAAHADHASDAASRARAAVRALAETDLFSLVLPGESGAVDVRALCLAREMLGYFSPLADAIFAVQGLGCFPVAAAGRGDQKGDLLQRAARGQAVFGFALTEPDAGSDVAAIATRAERSGDRLILHGDKTFISNAGIATHFVVFARTHASAGRRGLSAILVEADTPGLTIEPIPMSVDHPIGRLRFDGAAVAASAMVGEPGDGFRLAMRTLDTFRISVGAAAVGMARRALDETVARVRARHQFGKALSEQQTVQGYVAEMATEIDAARLLVLRAAYEKDHGEARASGSAAMAKMFATEAAQRVIDRAVQLFGGLGVTLGTTVERLYREIRPLRIYEGTTEIQRLIIARDVLGRGDGDARAK